MANVVRNPATPYVAPIPGGVHDGTVIHVKGIAERHHNGFLIALQCSCSIDPRSESPFVFNPRFTDNQVIRNSLRGGSWGAEERHGGFPFNQGSSFDVAIHIKQQHYSVHVDGRHFCDYSHRMPKERVTHLTCEQGIRIKEIRFEGGYPQPTPSFPGSGPIYNPPVPFVHHLGGLYPNKMIVISGIPHPGASRFSVNFQNGSDIAFHLDVRFNFGNSHNVVVRNHMSHHCWGSEERDLAWFPFSPDAWFEMMIMVEMSSYKVAVNNQHLMEFRHRIQPLGRFDTLRIDGDLRLTQVRFQG
ncbi:galectin-4-like isoform X4 [Mya arenaria]|uniref:galectin-4-like isoform X4 n=1 Tax=Mya arenaria TaxID=6604 RepID=UPI0022E7C57C|nr:galectin-4-like isoform X4 [Mya arenaria]XP_052768313.1 galectin-4-like isoform X4 [Mya arenaria]